MSLWTKTRAITWLWLMQRCVSMGRRCDRWANACAAEAAKIVPGMPAPPKL